MLMSMVSQLSILAAFKYVRIPLFTFLQLFAVIKMFSVSFMRFLSRFCTFNIFEHHLEHFFLFLSRTRE